MTDTREFTAVIDVDGLSADGVTRTLTPDEEARQAIARRLDLRELPSFAAEIRVMPWRSGGAVLTGHIEADVVQTCVVTLEPVPAHVADDFEVRYLPPSMIEPVKPGEELEFDAEDDDPPEALEGPDGTLIDAGEVAVQYLSLALDPYPRKPGAELPDEAKGEAEPSPFAVLEKLKQPPKT